MIVAQQSRRLNAKVARQELANSAYCSTKKLYDHGVKIHAIGDYRPGALQLPRYIVVTPAGMNDGPALESVAPVLAYREVYSDKAYEYLTRNPNLPFAFLTSVNKEEGPGTPGLRRPPLLHRSLTTPPAHRITVQLDPGENRHRVCQ